MWYYSSKGGDEMKRKFKVVSFTLLIILVLALSFACTPINDLGSNPDIDKTLDQKISMALGFLSDKYIKDNNHFIEISANNKNLELEILDNDLFDSLKSDEYYMVSYNEKNIVTSIESNEYIKDLVVSSMEEDDSSESPVIVSKEEKFDTSNLTLLDAYIVDINNNGEDETIAMYTRAEKNSDGEMNWDDGQDWLVLVQGKDNDYILFNDYVQLGTIQLFVYSIEDDFYITTIHSGSANLSIKEYRFNYETEEFEASVRFTLKGNVNMMHNTK